MATPHVRATALTPANICRAAYPVFKPRAERTKKRHAPVRDLRPRALVAARRGRDVPDERPRQHERNHQDRALQAAVSDEVQASRRRTAPDATAVACCSSTRPSAAARRPRALRAGAPQRPRHTPRAALAAIQRPSFLPLTASCLDDRRRAPAPCAPPAASDRLPAALTRHFIAIAAAPPRAPAPAVFRRRSTGVTDVAFLAPCAPRPDARARPPRHEPVSTHGQSLLVNDTPGSAPARLLQNGQWTSTSPRARPPGTAPAAPAMIAVPAPALGQAPRAMTERRPSRDARRAAADGGRRTSNLAVVATAALAPTCELPRARARRWR